MKTNPNGRQKGVQLETKWWLFKMADAVQSLTNHVAAKKNDPKAELTNSDRHQKEGEEQKAKKTKRGMKLSDISAAGACAGR